MLKITTEKDQSESESDRTRLVLEGRLAGPWVEELERYWKTMREAKPHQVLVDLSGVTFIAPEGKALLTRMWQQGADFHAMGCLTRCIVEEISKTDRPWGKEERS
jgi:ABC-type transporter Mla MlaB component